MWIAKVKIEGAQTFVGGLCKKYNICALAYPISTASDKNEVHVHFTLVLYGEENQKNEFYNELTKSKRIQGIERKGDFIIGNLKEDKKVEPMYKYSIIHADPIIIDKLGYEIWTVASFYKDDLNIFVKRMEDMFSGELLKFVSKEITNISIMSIHPELTDIQKKALEIAIENGYYLYPRKTEIKKLSKMMDISYSTYHAHLRKAEMKLLPFFFEKIL